MIALLTVALLCTPASPALPRATPPLRVTAYVDLSLVWSSGTLSVVEMRRGRFSVPTALPRYRGRFVATVRRKRQPLSETRFDLPLLADTESEDATPAARKLATLLRAGVTARATVRVGLPEGADEIVIRDSKSGRTITVSPAAPPAAGRGAPRAR